MSKIGKEFRHYLGMISILFGSFSSVFFLNGCNANNPIAINSEEEFFKMENKYYKLNCDLDLYGKSWTPLKVKGFNGNGHTISGLMIGSTDYWYDGHGKVASMFLASEKVENVTINRCTLVASDVETVSIVGISVKNYENVKVQKCTITSTISNSPKWYILSASILNSSRGPSYCNNISNCSISDCNVSLVNNTYVDYLVSGFDEGNDQVTKSKTLQNCSLQNCTFEVNSAETDVMFGGICARLPLSSGNNSIKASELKVDNCRVSIEAESVKVGGVFGTSYRYASTTSFEEFESKNIVSSNNYFYLRANNDLTFGGIAGRFDGVLNNALSKNNDADLYNKNKGIIYVGGALGNGALNTKYTVCDNNTISASSLKAKDDKNSFIGGIVGKQNGVLANSFISFKSSPSNFTNVSQVCQQASTYKNIYTYNGLENSDFTSLENKADFIDRLSLGSEWSITNDEIDLSF